MLTTTTLPERVSNREATDENPHVTVVAIVWPQRRLYARRWSGESTYRLRVIASPRLTEIRSCLRFDRCQMTTNLYISNSVARYSGQRHGKFSFIAGLHY